MSEWNPERLKVGLESAIRNTLSTLYSEECQTIRRESDGNTHEYCEVLFQQSSRDCDGPMTYKDREYLITESELEFVLADFFGSGGWKQNVTPEGRWDIYRRDQHEEGYHEYRATVYFTQHTDGT